MSIRSAFRAAGVPAGTAAREAPLAAAAMRERGITDQREARYFLAQVLHESGRLRYFEEIASGAAYEGRRDLGNVQPGDGRRYKGRGPIQLTGRANYRVAGAALRLPLEARPWLASQHRVGWRIAAWYWQSRGLSQLARRGDFIGVTRRINGGTNGLADRLTCLRAVSGHDCRPADPLGGLGKERRHAASKLLYHRRGALDRGLPKSTRKRHADHRDDWRRRVEAMYRRASKGRQKATLRRVLLDRDGRLG